MSLLISVISGGVSVGGPFSGHQEGCRSTNVLEVEMEFEPRLANNPNPIRWQHMKTVYLHV